MSKGVDPSGSGTVDENATVGAKRPARPMLARGSSVGRYLLLDQLGQGGMGVVYKAYDPELDRPVALKLLPIEEAGVGTLRDRLLREAQALARLSHPNVIAVHDVGTIGSDVFIAMEFVDGQTLRKWLAEKPRALSEILEVFLAAGAGLAAAHGAGLVHRDFKPDNVMVGNDGRVRVLDFGLARATEQSTETATAATSLPAVSADAGPAATPSVLERPHRSPSGITPSGQSSGKSRLLGADLTQAGSVVGTPRFMAPEQHLGAAVDEKVDQFSFCVSLYWALYGTYPFAGKTPDEYQDSVLEGRLVDPPAGTHVPRWLRQVLLRGLSREPPARHPSMDALLAGLRADPRAARRRWLTIAASLLLLAAPVGAWRIAHRQQVLACEGAERKLAGVWDDPRRSAVRAAFRRSGQPYVETVLGTVERVFDGYARDWVAMHVEACTATHLRKEQSQELLDLRMECLDQQRVQMGALVDLFTQADAQVVEKSVQAASSLGSLQTCANAALLKAPVRPPSDPAARAKVDELRKRIAIAKALSEAGKYDQGVTIARAAVDEARGLGYRPVQAEALFRLGSLEDGAGKYKEAEQALVEAAAAAVSGHVDNVAAEAWTRLLQVVGYRQQRVEDARRWELFAEAAVERIGTEELRADLLVAQAMLLGVEGNHEEALAQERRALTIREKVLGPAHPDTASGLNNIGADLNDLGRNEEALTYYRRALAIDEKLLGPQHPVVGDDLTNMGAAAADLGLYEEGEAYAARALAIHEKALGPTHPSLSADLDNLGSVLILLHRSREALPLFGRALEIDEKALGPAHPALVTSLTGMGEALLDLHAANRALGPLERSLMLGERNTIRADSLAETQFALARALRETGGDRARAKKLAVLARDGFSARPTINSKKQLTALDAWLASRAD
jgi:serine/threonine protein kinase/tetratricopeptide (TPR) repeat protein